MKTDLMKILNERSKILIKFNRNKRLVRKEYLRDEEGEAQGRTLSKNMDQ